MQVLDKTLKPQADCSVEIRKVWTDGRTTGILTFSNDEDKSDWIGSEDYNDFCKQALNRCIDCLIFISPGGVEGLHRIRTRPKAGLRRRPINFFAYEAF